MREQVLFFYRHAGYSYNPLTETAKQGRYSCAKKLADAETAGKIAGLSFAWEVSDIDSRDFSKERPAWSLWDCVCRDESGAVVASLSAVDFGRDGEPWGDPYRRVVESELALESLG